MATRNKLLITREIRIGKHAAENDDLLFDCFVDNVALSEACDIQSNGSIVAGRTGSGKSAIIRYIKKNKKHYEFSPSEMAMQYISNSDIIRFLNDIGADLNILFQVVWKHVILVEYVRLKYNINSDLKSSNWFTRLSERFSGDRSKAKAIDYLRRYSSTFWIEADETVRELTKSFETRLHAELGIDVAKHRTKAGYGRNLSNAQKIEIAARVRKIISSEQLQELSKVLDLLGEEESRGASWEAHYLVIDGLDERWVDDSIRYKLINSLVEALNKFRKIRSLKIVVALRTDVIERATQENKDFSFQREKFRDYIIPLSWNEEQLKHIIDKRISTVFRRKYAPNKQVLFDDVFSDRVGSDTAFRYIVDRTLMRPRDIIDFVNECLTTSENKPEVSPKDIYKAEERYSGIRHDALVDEWRSAFPNLERCLQILRQKPASIPISGFSAAEIDALAVDLYNSDAIDSLGMMAADHFEKNTDLTRRIFFNNVVAVLYRIGAVGLKLDKDDRFKWVYRDNSAIRPTDISERATLRVSLMLQKSLKTLVNYR